MDGELGERGHDFGGIEANGCADFYVRHSPGFDPVVHGATRDVTGFRDLRRGRQCEVMERGRARLREGCAFVAWFVF